VTAADAGVVVPTWLRPIIRACAGALPGQLADAATPPDDGSARESAVLILFGDTAGHPDVLLIQRSLHLRSHPGQVAFPGGRVEPVDPDVPATALREAVEETGLDPAGVETLATLPPLWVPNSGNAVTPVVAWWREPSPVWAADRAEVASVHRIRLDDLLEPAHRLQIRYPNGWSGPAFRADGLLVWGFTAGVLAGLFDIAGVAKPWDRTRVEDFGEVPEIYGRGAALS